MDAVRRINPACLADQPYPLKLAVMHLWRNGYLPDLRQPRRFNELVQARKLHDRDPRLPIMADKINVKKVVSERLGPEWVIPTLWHGTVLPVEPEWPLPFVLKSSHGCNQCVFVRTADHNWARTRRKAHRWLGRRYGQILEEWLYQKIEPQLLVEPFVGDGDMLPTDYKLFVFGGRAEFIQVDTNREHAHRRAIFDRAWRRLPVELLVPTDRREIPPPASLPLMIEGAEALGQGFDFARVDLYEVDGRPRFGEMTFYPGSGLSPFRPTEYDRFFGAYWLQARSDVFI